MTQDELIKKLEERLGTPAAKTFDLHLVEAGIRFEDDWWYVPVASGVDSVNAFQYSPVLNEIEELFEKDGTRLLLIPALTN